jgi:lambda family phage portal protein
MRDAIAAANKAPTLVDRLVGYFSPRMAADRQRARISMALANSYTGASKSRRATSEWQTTSGSADADLLWDLPALRDRSRDLVRNSPLAGGAIHTVVTRTVGTGLAMQPAIKRDIVGLTDEEVEAWQENTQARFWMWANGKDCDLARGLNFYELQELAFRSTLENGDVLGLLPRRRRPGRSNALAVQLIEADRLCNKDRAGDTTILAGGIEIDTDGAPKNYHIAREHPGDRNRSTLQWDVVPAFGAKSGRRNVLHLYRRLRIGQRRGVPYLAPVIETLKQLDRYTEAEIMAAVVSGLFTVFVKSEDGSGLDLGSGMATETGSSNADHDVKLAAGAIIDLAEGESIETANPGRPNANFDPFFLAIVRQIGVGLELPFEVLIKHFNSSYSAARAALLDAWLFIRCRRDWLASNFCQPIYEAWLEEEIAGGYIDAPGFFDDPMIRYAYCCAEWVGDGPGSIDPVKEVTAAEKRIALGISNRAKESMLHDGGNWRDNSKQLGREEIQRRQDGISEVANAQALAAAQPAAAAPEDGNDDGEDDSPPPANRRQPAEDNAGLIAAGLHALAGAVQARPAPVVQVAAPVVTVESRAPQIDVHLPGQVAMERIPVRDEHGVIVKLIDRPATKD